MNDFLEIVRNACGDDDVELRVDYPFLHLVDGVTDSKLLTLEVRNNFSYIVDGDPHYYGVTSKALGLINWAPFNSNYVELDVDECGGVEYPEDIYSNDDMLYNDK